MAQSFEIRSLANKILIKPPSLRVGIYKIEISYSRDDERVLFVVHYLDTVKINQAISELKSA